MAELNSEWAEAVLRRWIDEATRCLDPGEAYGRLGTAKVEALTLREHQTQVVLQRVLGGDVLPTLMNAIHVERIVELGTGIESARYALGVLVTRVETLNFAGSAAPVMAADDLHATVWDAASQLWSDGHFGQAVQRAATFLNAHVQDRLNRHDLSDATLMQQAFSSTAPEAGKPRLRWPGKDDDLTVKAMRGGILNFSQGCFMAIRNPATHGSDQHPRQVWLEQLATLSTLARWIDECEVLSADET